MSNNKPIAQLLMRFLQGTLTAEEEQELRAWVAEDVANQAVLDRLTQQDRLREDLNALKQLTEGPRGEARISRMRTTMLRLTQTETIWSRRNLVRGMAATTILVLLVFGVSKFSQQPSELPTIQIHSQVQLTPQGKGVTLRLSDGQTIDLRPGENGILMDKESFAYQDGSDSIVSLKTTQSRAATSLTLTTPNGGIYRVTLSDGTRVWLNAATELKYPLHFGREERRVELDGEAYFEVAKSEVPFKVYSKNQEIKVLGTHFNVRSYLQENTTTTLLEGRVQVAYRQGGTQQEAILHPGKEAILTRAGFSIREADIEKTMAWKQGDFVFRGMTASEALQEIGRWYNMEVVLSDGVEKYSFIPGGILSRDRKLKDVLNIISQSSSLRFEIEGRRIYVK